MCVTSLRNALARLGSVREAVAFQNDDAFEMIGENARGQKASRCCHR